MFNNVYIETSKEELLTYTFCYDKELHKLKFPLANGEWVTMEDVDCVIKIDRPMVYVSVTRI